MREGPSEEALEGGLLLLVLPLEARLAEGGLEAAGGRPGARRDNHRGGGGLSSSAAALSSPSSSGLFAVVVPAGSRNRR
jgi:hypothetical protein